jgi:hypothetical protein
MEEDIRLIYVLRTSLGVLAPGPGRPIAGVVVLHPQLDGKVGQQGVPELVPDGGVPPTLAGWVEIVPEIPDLHLPHDRADRLIDGIGSGSGRGPRNEVTILDVLQLLQAVLASAVVILFYLVFRPQLLCVQDAVSVLPTS